MWLVKYAWLWFENLEGLQLMKSLSFYTPPTWKRFPFGPRLPTKSMIENTPPPPPKKMSMHKKITLAKYTGRANWDQLLLCYLYLCWAVILINTFVFVGSFFDKFAFFLPCLFNCLILLISLVLAYFHLPETLVKR